MKNLIFIVILGIIFIGGTAMFGGKGNTSSQPIQATDQATEPYFTEEAAVKYFYSEACTWCQKEKVILTELSQEGYRVKPMDVGSTPQLWRDYNLTGTPTFIGRDDRRLEGYQEKEPLKAFLDKYK